MLSPADQYEAALEQAVKDEEQARAALEAARAQIGTMELQLANVAAVVDALLSVIPGDRRGPYFTRVRSMRPATKSNRGSTAYEATVLLLDQHPPKEWSAPEVRAALAEQGATVELEQVHNVLNYLTRKKRLMRTSRGRFIPSAKTAGAVVETTPAA